MNKRAISRAAFALLVLTISLGVGRPTLTLTAAVTDGSAQEFILRAPADRIEAIASRYGLTVVRPVEGHPDVFLVRAVQPLTSSLSPSADGTSAATQQLTSRFPQVGRSEIVFQSFIERRDRLHLGTRTRS